MDLSKLSDDDLIALSNNNLGAMSNAGLKLLSAGDMPAPKKGLGAAQAKALSLPLVRHVPVLNLLYHQTKALKKV